MVISKDANQRNSAAELLGRYFFCLDNLENCWQDLIILSKDNEPEVRRAAIGSLGLAFYILPDKQQAWNILVRLTKDSDETVRLVAAGTLGGAYSFVPEKQLAWQNLIELTHDEDRYVQWIATETLGWIFRLVPEKWLAWEDLISLTRYRDAEVRWRAATSLVSSFSHAPDKQQAWKILTSLTRDEDSITRWIAARGLGWVFSDVLDKERAWQDIHGLAKEKDIDIKRGIAESLGSAFFYLPDKNLAWQDLSELTRDEIKDIRRKAAKALGLSFLHLPDKQSAWLSLHRLTQDNEAEVRVVAAKALGLAFPYVPDKILAWQDLHKLIRDENKDVVRMAAKSLGLAFSHMPYRNMAWQDLHNLAINQNDSIRSEAAGAIGSAFLYIPNREQAWQDLHNLIKDQNCFAKREATRALGLAFPILPNKDKAMQDLHTITEDADKYSRCSSHYALGRASIFFATEAQDLDEFKGKLEEAIEFFSESSKEYEFRNPAAFCLPFYRSLHSFLFTEVPKEEEVQKYLDDAKEAIEASESKEVLLEAVNNLSKALQEVRTYSIDDIILRKRDLKSYTKYCLKTAECLREARDKTPLASKIIDYTLVEKSIPIVDQKIKVLFRDVEAVARRLCKSTKGTNLEAFGKDAYESTRGLNKIDSWIVADRYLEDIVPLLKRHCDLLPYETRKHLKELIESQDSTDIERRYYTLKLFLIAALGQAENDSKRAKELERLLEISLQNIEFAMSKLNISSSKVRGRLYELKTQLDNLQKEIESQGLNKKELAEALDKKDRAMIERLNKIREDMIKAVRDTALLNASKKDVGTILKELETQDRLKRRDVLGIIADISSLAWMVREILL
jgi:HEAT repeat protein